MITAGTRRNPRCSTATIVKRPPIYRENGLTDVNYPAYPAASHSISHLLGITAVPTFEFDMSVTHYNS